MADNSMLSFYRDHSVAPVRQEITDLDAHFARRRVLYQQLGIPASAFTGRRVLEIGPGTGQNALFVAAQRPSQLVLVEPNPTGGKEIDASFEPFPAWREILSLHKLPIEQFRDTIRFCFVRGISGSVWSSRSSCIDIGYCHACTTRRFDGNYMRGLCCIFK